MEDGVTTSRVRVCWPPPHETEQVPKEVQGPTTQSTGTSMIQSGVKNKANSMPRVGYELELKLGLSLREPERTASMGVAGAGVGELGTRRTAVFGNTGDDAHARLWEVR